MRKGILVYEGGLTFVNIIGCVVIISESFQEYTVIYRVHPHHIQSDNTTLSLSDSDDCDPVILSTSVG